MGKKIFINNKYNSFKKTISIDGDKSISIRALLLGSQACGKTFIENILILSFPLSPDRTPRRHLAVVFITNKN